MRNRRPPPLLLLALASSALLLSGCASFHLADLPAPLRVELPVICERILTPVEMPDVGPNDDARVAFMKDDAALMIANARIVEGKACVKDERENYSGEGSN